MKKLAWFIIFCLIIGIISLFVAPQSLGQVSNPSYFKLIQNKIQPIVQSWGLDFTNSTITSTILCLTGDSCITTWPTGGGGGSVSTSTSETANYFPYWTSTAGSPATLAGTSTLYQLNGNIGVGTTTPLKALQVAGEVNAITSVTRRTNVGFSGLDAANNAAFPRAFFYGYSGSAISNFGFYAASGDATGTTQTPVFSGVSTNASPTQASSRQGIHYLDTTKYVIYTTQAENTQRAVPIYIGHFTQPDITVATNTFIGLGNVTNPSARLSLSASTVASGGIAFGTDTNLYRSAADVLTTDDSLIIAGNATSTNFFATGLSFTNANGTSITSTNLFATSSHFINATSTNFWFTTSTGVALNISSIVSTTALQFGSATGDTLTLNSLLSSPTVSTTELSWDGTPNTDHSAVGNVTQTFNAGVTTTAMDVLFLSASGTWRLANASTSTSSTGMLAIGLAAGSPGNPLKVALPNSFVRDDSWNWTPGQTLYVSTVNGAVTSTAPSATDQVVRIIGYAVTADVIFWNPSNNYLTLN